jgi:hypothetical protein
MPLPHWRKSQPNDRDHPVCLRPTPQFTRNVTAITAVMSLSIVRVS